MATWCVDASATGAGSGLDWDNAFTSINACLENPLHAVEDTYLCRGTFVMSAYFGASPGHINFVGVNALGIEDGTNAVIDCNGLSGNIFCFVSGGQIRSKRFRNFKFQNWAGTLFTGSSGYLGLLMFVRCKFTLGQIL